MPLLFGDLLRGVLLADVPPLLRWAGGASGTRFNPKEGSVPHDLYGTYYASERDALNAEMAQCAGIDAAIAARDVRGLQERAEEQGFYLEQWQRHIEERISILEQMMPMSLCVGECR